MTTQEMNEIWRLIGFYRQGDKRFQDKELLKAWYAVLRVYDVEEVKDAVVEHFRNSSFFPDVTEITARLPQRTEGGPRVCQIPTDPAAQMEREKWQRWVTQWHQELHARGLPTLHEALEAGMTLAQWNAKLREADGDGGGCEHG